MLTRFFYFLKKERKENVKTLLDCQLHTSANMTVVLRCCVTHGSGIMLQTAPLDGGVTTALNRGLFIFRGKIWAELHQQVYRLTEV